MLLILVMLAVLVIISQPVFSAEYTCSSCSDCSSCLTNGTLSSGDTLKLSTDIENPGGSCINFNGKDNVTLDCDGFTVSGPGMANNYGILLSGSTNSTVMNCVNVSYFRYGIYLNYSYSNNLTNITAPFNTYFGIYVYYSDNNTFTNITISDGSTYDGISMHHSNSNTFTTVASTGNNQKGINLTVSHNNTFTGINVSYSTLSDGFYMTNSDNNTLNSVTALDNNNYGVNMYISHNNNLTGIRATGSSNGMFVSLSSNNTLTDVNVSYNSAYGIYINSGSGHVVTNLTASGCNHGVYLKSSLNTLTDITTRGNTGSGFYIYDNSNNTISNVNSSGNEYGIHLGGTSDYNNISGSRIENNSNAGLFLDIDGIFEPESNIIYNSYFNNTGTNGNVRIDDDIDNPNYLNTTRTGGVNILGGVWIGGNYWTNSSGTGFSDTCTDSEPDGICDSEHNLSYLSSVAYDYLPLAANQSAGCDSCSDCNTKIQSASGGSVIYLVVNITDQDGSCIDFNGKDNVTFDCDGFTIGGDGDSTGYGIYLSNVSGGSNNNTIRNCTDLKGFSAGIYLYNNSNNTLININANTNEYGIYLKDSNSTVFTDITTHNNSESGIYLDDSRDSTITNVNASNNDYGIYSAYSNNNTLDNITVNYNQEIGLYLDDSHDYAITDITASNNNGSTSDGIYLVDSHNNTFSAVTARSNTYAGIELYGSNNNNFTDINVSDNMVGFDITESNNTLLANITAYNNTMFAVYLLESLNTTMRNVTMIKSEYGGGLFFAASLMSHLANDIDTSNTVNGKAVQFYDGTFRPCPDNQTIDFNTSASFIGLAGCYNVTLNNTYANDEIFLAFTNESTIINSSVSDTFVGIYGVYAYGNTFTNITVTSSLYGLVMIYSDNNTINNLNASYNTNPGISGPFSQFNATALYIIECSNNTISGATLNNNDMAILLDNNAIYNTINDSRIENNAYGIFTASSGGDYPNYNIIYNNYFSSNTHSYTSDDGNITNYWNIARNCSIGTSITGGSCVGGNYWSDYTGQDTSGDRIGETTLVLDANNTDYLPLTLSTYTGGNGDPGGSPGGAPVGAASSPECEAASDCSDDQSCSDGECADITCECGYIESHACVEYECCNNEDCSTGYTCTNNTCVLVADDAAEALEFIERVERSIQEKSGDEYNLTESMELLQRAKNAYQDGNYTLSNDLSQQALDSIERVIGPGGDSTLLYALLAVCIAVAAVALYYFRGIIFRKGPRRTHK